MPTLDSRKLRKKPPAIDNLLGTYHWVWDGHPEAEEDEITPDDKMEKGGLTLSLKPGTRVAKPASVVGAFKLGMIGGKFEGLVKWRGGWVIKRVAWEGYDVEDIPEEGQGLWVTKVLDDNGNPFMGMFVEEGEGDLDAQYHVLAKKQKEGYVWGKRMKWEGLTEAEKQRVGLVDDDEEQEDDDDEKEEENEADEETEEENGTDDETEEDDDDDEENEEGADKSPTMPQDLPAEALDKSNSVTLENTTQEANPQVPNDDEQKGVTSKRKAELDEDSETGKKVRRV